MSEKLKSSDLRSGNYVYICGEIRKCNAVTIANFERGLISAPKPIPLTSEILLACGFVWKNNGLRKENICIRQIGDYWTIFLSNESFNFKIDLQYLHQIQNVVYYLFNQELEFKPELK